MRSAASRPAVVELLHALARVMQHLSARWYVFGAQAASVHGRPRMTADVDVAVELRVASSHDLVRELATDEIVLRFEPSTAFLAETRLLPMVHATSGLPVDVLVTGPGLEEEFLDRARLVEVDGVAVPFVSAEDLVAMKILAGRRKDLDDVRGVLAAQAGKLDLERTRDVLAALEAALDEPRLLRRLDRLLGSARARRRPARRS
jgi:predicted nucleotidyltransferase